MTAPPKPAQRSTGRTDPERRLGNVPSRVGKYVVERKLASGGMGTVYLARDPEGARIALKCIHPQMAEREDLVAMFVDEARIASRI
ncbi:MAG: serine/threonine protein kinase, partial [Deltaproteobacteria bacterium]|nr:serine/threonine protein kinase [Deltaproteobacteria bacterium]